MRMACSLALRPPGVQALPATVVLRGRDSDCPVRQRRVDTYFRPIHGFGMEVPDIFDYGQFSFASKDEVLEKAKTYWNPGKTQFWIDAGVPLVIDRREDYFLYDMSGRRLIDVHLNGGTYNLGHRNPEVVEAVTAGMGRFD